MENKTCIKRKHVFLGTLLAYPIGYTLYSWYYWFTHLHLVEQVRFYLLTEYSYVETSLWDYTTYPFSESTGAQGGFFVLSTLWIVACVIFIILNRIYSSKFMSKCVIKR